ncbi:hypothetical protein [[Clostridium] colinum]|uniref:hypothetical protein n=1 Tax=[Clostridium] colinum TaxID=36835 RepID=UPI00202430D5|nr:hypothetical protein [[Clostridium] colinum]
MTKRERRKLVAIAIYKNSKIFKKQDIYSNILISTMLFMSMIGCIRISYLLYRFIIYLI